MAHTHISELIVRQHMALHLVFGRGVFGSQLSVYAPLVPHKVQSAQPKWQRIEIELVSEEERERMSEAKCVCRRTTQSTKYLISHLFTLTTASAGD